MIWIVIVIFIFVQFFYNKELIRLKKENGDLKKVLLWFRNAIISEDKRREFVAKSKLYQSFREMKDKEFFVQGATIENFEKVLSEQDFDKKCIKDVRNFFMDQGSGEKICSFFQLEQENAFEELRFIFSNEKLLTVQNILLK